MSLDKKIVLITGASRGIGKAIAQELQSRGHFVIGTATSLAGAEQISEYLGNTGLGVVLNIREADACEQLIERLSQENLVPEILINNAGVTADNLLLRMTDEEWLDVIDTNLTGVFRMTRACLKNMFRARWGRIVNIASVVGATGNSGQVNYTSTKAGIVGFSKSLAQEMASRGITVNVVAPGFIDTDMTAVLPDMVKDELLKRIPMKRLGKPEDIAKAVAFFVSDDASYVTGQTIHVNGGMYMV
ncbi:MAG: 3-oxoacyl-[acyl-carrier-protein] reductase [Pseudomonadota bacterium]|nr:3-oxoacyl-[acyl-carrier-protein] reductase [Pseudomonadota bacterium]